MDRCKFEIQKSDGWMEGVSLRYSGWMDLV